MVKLGKKLKVFIVIATLFLLVTVYLSPAIFWSTKAIDGFYKINHPSGWNVQLMDGDKILIISSTKGEVSTQDLRRGEKARVTVWKLTKDKPDKMGILVKQTVSLLAGMKYEQKEKTIDGFPAIEINVDKSTDKSEVLKPEFYLFVDDEDYVYEIQGGTAFVNQLEKGFYFSIVKRIVSSFSLQ